MHKKIHQTEILPFPHYGMRGYQIEVDVTDRNIHLQRHIWHREDGSIDKEDWVRTFYEDEQKLKASGFKLLEHEQ